MQFHTRQLPRPRRLCDKRRAHRAADYRDVPLLGPPLPGDLGRPILAHQRESGVEAGIGHAADAEQRARQSADAERQRLAAERRSAMESGVMLQITSGNQAQVSPPPRPAGQAAPEASDGSVTDGAQDFAIGGHRRGNAIADHGNSASDINPYDHVALVSEHTLVAGTVIAASLITGINSDVPGVVTAQVTENAYDSITGRTLLIPQGSRLIGSYDSVVAFGQSRALVVWQRIILPDGSSVRIDNVPATDPGGYSGLTDRIDRHTWQLLKGVGLSTLLGLGTELRFHEDEGDLVRAFREAAQEAGSRAGDQVVARSLDIRPTLRVRPGWPLRVVVHKDIIMRPWRASGA